MEFGTFYQLPCAPTQSPQERYEETLMQSQHAEMQPRLQNMTYEEANRTFAIYGEPSYCIDRIQAMKEMFGINQFIG